MNKVFQTLSDGITYQGLVMHSVINYALIGLTVLPHLVPAKTQATINASKWYWALITSVFVQVLLWFSADAVGVSVIWSAMAGFNLMTFQKGKPAIKTNSGILLMVSLTAALSGVIYYAITLPPITTLAHIVAALMGVGLFYLYRRKRFKG